MSSPVDFDRYLETLQVDRCPLCFLLHDYIHGHLRSLLEESSTDPKTRKALTESHGFCRRHAWQAVEQNQSLDMAVIYGGLFESRLKNPTPSTWWKKKKPCPICLSEEKRDQTQIRQFAMCWDHTPKLRQAFEEKGILCFDHFEKILAQKMNPIHKKSLRARGVKALENVLKDLNEFLAKQDYHRSHESLGLERDAWIRAVRMISGERDR
jgi:hypothetical protein